jgi:hypothetical protein
VVLASNRHGVGSNGHGDAQRHPAADDSGRNTTVQGTSCATPVDAGIAAFVVDLARAHLSVWKGQSAKLPENTFPSDTRDIFDKLCERLRNEQVMKRVLWKCMTRTQLGRYNMIIPEKLLNVTKEQNWQEEAIIAFRTVLKDDHDNADQQPKHP